MDVPENIDRVISEFDRDGGRLDTHSVQSALSSARTTLQEKTPSNEAWADLAAFAFQEEQGDHGPWNTYFGPMSSHTMGDGTIYYSPDPGDVTPDIIDHWLTRADRLVHPVLKARYADLVWDFAPHVTNKRADVRFARMAIDSYIAAVLEMKNSDGHDDVASLKRALELSTSIRDADRTAVAKNAMLARFHTEVDKDGLWFHLFESLIGNRKCGLTLDERGEMVSKLENLLAVHVDDDTLDAHSAELVADCILPIYIAARDTQAIKRISAAVSEAFEKIARSGSRTQAMAWLAAALKFARRSGDEERYNALKVERENAIRDSASEMQSFGFSQDIQKSEVDEVVDGLVDGDNPQQALFNIAAYFIVPKDELRYRAVRGARAAPLMSALTMSVIADDHVAATVDADDGDGTLFRYADISRQANRLFLSEALDAAVARHALSPEEVAAFMQRSSLFSEFPLVVAGVKAWMDGDYVKCMFVLVPQIEDAFRNIARSLGESVTKDKRGQKGWEVSMNLGDFLSMPSVQVEIGQDIHFWVKAIFSDARGMNLRNTVAHGLAGRDAATYYNCEAIIHSMLVLGAYKDVAVASARKAAARRERRKADNAE
ncbi:DUF4209 domain-containing protein [Rhizobium sp. R693]|uniref:DUF4209 domain-containing protein n=1 Tax=Rhizobium sp. R693 TaxID=1764276 RepID=UPI000B536B2D|nr:DUF4209 domain-containing protein [Rhizobium sp. R693]OWV82702.1 hypothetical protein ATY79_15005 [Rhizobium sp. R693]